MPRSVVSNDCESAFEWSPAPSYVDGSGRSYRVGELIQHSDFGPGVISKLEGEGNELVLVVAFEKVGTKKRMAKTAPIAYVTNVHGETEQ